MYRELYLVDSTELMNDGRKQQVVCIVWTNNAREVSEKLQELNARNEKLS